LYALLTYLDSSSGYFYLCKNIWIHLWDDFGSLPKWMWNECWLSGTYMCSIVCLKNRRVRYFIKGIFPRATSQVAISKMWNFPNGN